MTRRETPLDAAEILRALDRNGVDYVLIGGLAVQAHGHVRTTQDADIFPSDAHDNLDRLARALAELEARPAATASASAGPPSAAQLSGSTIHTLETTAGGLDVHLEPPGAADWRGVRARALVLEVVGTTVPVASRDDLIAMKLAAGRPIDRGDVLALTESDQPR